MKKVKILAVVLLLGVLTACGNPASQGKGKKGADKTSDVSQSKSAELSIEDAYFIEPLGGDNDEEQEYIALTVKVKNKAKSSMHIWDESFYLTEKGDDEKISALRLDSESKMESFMGEIAAGKSLTGTVVFAVDSSQDYMFNFSSAGFDDKGKSLEGVEMALDLAKYEDTKKKMEEPKKALQAYIDVVLLQKENEDFETLVGNDAEADIAMIEKEYTKHMKDTFYSFRPSEDQFKDAFSSYVVNQKEAIETKLTVVGYVGNLAKIEVDYTGISAKAVSDLINEYEDEYSDSHDGYDSEKNEEFAFTKLEDIYSEAEVGEPRDDIFVTITKKKDKWVIDFKGDESYENTQLRQAYLGNVD